MADLAIAVLIGRLTRDAELKYTSGGQAICHFAIATSAKKKKGDQWIDEASFWDVDLWGKQGESLNQYLVKGKQVGVEGTMSQDRWEQDGQQRMKVKINANSVQLLGSRGDGQAENRSAPAQNQGPAARPPVNTPDDFSDDIPFNCGLPVNSRLQGAQ